MLKANINLLNHNNVLCSGLGHFGRMYINVCCFVNYSNLHITTRNHISCVRQGKP